jgi:hypothetical protein
MEENRNLARGHLSENGGGGYGGRTEEVLERSYTAERVETPMGGGDDA